MTTPPRLDLNKLVAQIVLDVALIKWFADNGRRIAALSAIAVTRAAKGPHAVLDFLERHCGGLAMNSPRAPTTLEAAAAEVDRLTSELVEQFQELAYNQNAVIRLKAGDRAIAGCQAPRPWPSPTSEPRCGLRVCALRSMIGWSTTKVETWASN